MTTTTGAEHRTSAGTTRVVVATGGDGTGIRSDSADHGGRTGTGTGTHPRLAVLPLGVGGIPVAGGHLAAGRHPTDRRLTGG